LYRFECDYLEGADAEVLNALVRTNAEQTPGYGEDDCCASARTLITGLCERPGADVHFFVGGTQVNLTVIAAALRPFEGVLCADTGHINVHETGAVEATGHKVLALPSTDGKITAAQVRDAFESHINDVTHEHRVRPAMIYLSHPTEMGTLYTRAELEALNAVAREYHLKLYVDGARLSYGLAAEPDVNLPFLAAHTDAFTLGGTKCGALFGEALVLPKPEDWPFFRYHIKQRGALLAKGRLLGVQFSALLSNGHYQALGAKANAQAQRLKAAFLSQGIPMLCDTLTNQIFPVLPNHVMAELGKNFSFAYWTAVDGEHTAVRFCVGATTPEPNADVLMAAILALQCGANA
jgi:threonine aldolase